ncbi:arylsulfatase [Carboxylicivirga caseinilyticus]|uniref:arylsulfatase n=1 Tax=Carboxylicivirga caseinilyticus TaxID=3417572 RepID=UPI003D33FE96
MEKKASKLILFKIYKLLIASLVIVMVGCAPKKLPQETKPNIVLIMLDDLGYSDLGCYGGEINTPNIDQLASEGIRFTQMHNSARCCPTRASLLTGQHPQVAGINGMGVNLSMNTATIPEVLVQNGYQTGMTGKWHLSTTKALPDHNEQLQWLANRVDHGPFSPLENYPCNRGFQEHWGVIWGVVNFFDPFSLVHNEEAIKEVPEDFYMTNFVTDKSIDLLEQFSEKEEPFFMYVAHTAPHWPLHALPEDMAKYQGVYDGGWDSLRTKRYERMLELGLIDEETYPLTPNSSGRSWEECEKKEYEANCMEVHAAMVDRVDQGVGKIVTKLKELGIYDNTIIMVLSDNGASPERGYPPGFDRPGFTRDSVIIEYNAQNPGSGTTWNYIGSAWASAVNTPFRYWKKESYEGGSATPFIVSWPEKLKDKANTINRGFAHVADVLPTCLDVADCSYPDSINGMKAIKPVGSSFLPLVEGNVSTTHDVFVWEHEGGKAVRVGDWKMSALPGQPWELFNISHDHTESDNLSSQYPQKVKDLDKIWKDWADKTGIRY